MRVISRVDLRTASAATLATGYAYVGAKLTRTAAASSASAR